MKTSVLMLLYVIIFFQMETQAAEAPLNFSRNVTQIQLGVMSPTGLLGLSQDYTVTEHHSLVAGVGLDPAGALLSLGYRYHDHLLKQHKTETFLDKCFFLFECESRPFVGMHFTRASGGTWTITNEADEERAFEVSGVSLLNGEFGFQTAFRSGIVTSLSFNYRTPLEKAKVRLRSGVAEVDDESSIRNWYQGLGITFGLGYTY